MTKILPTAAFAGAALLGLLTGSASALTAAPPDGIRTAADASDLTQQVRWVCRYNYYGRRHCFWVRPGAYYSYGYYPYGYNPYWRHHRRWWRRY